MTWKPHFHTGGEHLTPAVCFDQQEVGRTVGRGSAV